MKAGALARMVLLAVAPLMSRQLRAQEVRLGSVLVPLNQSREVTCAPCDNGTDSTASPPLRVTIGLSWHARTPSRE